MSTFVIYKCRICRQDVFTESHLSDYSGCSVSTLLFVDESKGPPWITETIQQGDFLKGKLNCPHCKGRLGAFDFLSHISCACGQHTIPPVRVLKDRVDVAQIVGNQSVVTIFRKKRPFGKQQGNEVSSISNQNIVKSTAQSEQSSVSTSAQQCNSGSETENIGTMSSEDVSRGASCETLPCDQENSESCHNAEDNCENSENSNVEDVNIFSFLNQEEFVNEEEDTSETKPLPAIEEDPLTCPVCLELFYLPQQCEPCKHVFCDPCLRQLNASASFGANVKCPLCRNVIRSCTTHKDFLNKIKSNFPEEYSARKRLAKKMRRTPLPGKPMSLARLLRQGNRNGSSDHRVLLAGMCFLVLITILGFTVFAVTIGFLSWYLLEISIELVVDLTTELSTFFEVLRCVIILVCVDGMKEEYLHSLFNSSTRVLMAFAKVIRTDEKYDDDLPHSVSDGHPKGVIQQQIITDGREPSESIQENMTRRTNELLMKMSMQASIANYVVVGCLVTYLLYRLAKYMQMVRANGR